MVQGSNKTTLVGIAKTKLPAFVAGEINVAMVISGVLVLPVNAKVAIKDISSV